MVIPGVVLFLEQRNLVPVLGLSTLMITGCSLHLRHCRASGIRSRSWCSSLTSTVLTLCSAHALVQFKCHSWSSQWGTTEAKYVLVRSVVGWHGCMVSASVRERYEKMSYRPLRRNIPREPVPRLVLISQLAVVGIPEAAIGPVTCVGRLCKHALI